MHRTVLNSHAQDTLTMGLVDRSVELTVTVLLVVMVTEALYLKKYCSKESDCPKNSHCAVSTCEGNPKLCQCNKGWMPKSSLEPYCVRVKLLGEKCSGEDMCLGMNTECSGGKCKCIDLCEPTKDKTACKIKVPKVAALGEPCSKSRECDQRFEQICSGTCVCVQGKRPKTITERYLDPMSVERCITKTEDVKPYCYLKLHDEL